MKNAYISADQKSRPNDPLWYFLAEYSLSEFFSEHDKGDGFAADMPDQIKRELRLPPESVKNIEMTLTRFAREALARFKHARFGLPVRIRVFCQKKEAEEKMLGGWGYFLIERTEAASESPTARCQHFVDLYIYQEGD